MFDLATGEFNFNNPVLWIDFSISVLLLLSVFFVIFKLINRKLAYFTYSGFAILTLVSWFFSLRLVWFISLAVLIVLLITFIVVNIADVRPYLANSLAGKNENAKGSDKIFDRHALYSKINTAVTSLSKSRTGALITFERNVELDDVVKSGTILNAPVTPELLTTIFYPGTRLHDGAVVIRKDLILAASVYYTPTTKPLTGKYGSRHRAAIGISEITDSVTVVVSEETGRISLAVSGELIPVNLDTFLRTFEDYMFEEDNKINNSKESKLD